MHASQYRHIGLSVKTHIGATLKITAKISHILTSYYVAMILYSECKYNLDSSEPVLMLSCGFELTCLLDTRET